MYSIEHIAQKLDNWAKTKNGENGIGILIEKLIKQSIANVIEIDFQTGKQTNRSSYDGVTRVLETPCHPYIPSGKCVWEVSVEEAVTKKVEGDYCKRSEQIDKKIASLQEFIFSTPRRWLDAQKWADEKNKEEAKKWKNVRAYDSYKLAKWIDYEIFGKHVLNEVIPNSYSNKVKNFQIIYEECICGILSEKIIFEENYDCIERIVDWCLNKENNYKAIKCIVPSQLEAFHSISVFLKETNDINLSQKSRFVFIDADDVPMEQIINLREENVLILFNKCTQEVYNFQKKKGFKILILTDGKFSFPGIKEEKMQPISESNISKMLAHFSFSPDEIQEILAISGANYENIRKNILRR